MLLPLSQFKQAFALKAEMSTNVYTRSALDQSGIGFAFATAWEIQRWII